MSNKLDTLIPPSKFKDIVGQYLEYYFAVNELSHKTFLNYQSYSKNIYEFLDYIKHPDLLLTEVDHSLMDDLTVYMRKKGNLTYVSRTIELCKNVMSYAKLKKLTDRNDILDVKTKRSKVKEIVHLEENELQRFVYPQLLDQEYQIVMDLYTFQAHTGMSFGDLWSYKIVTDYVGTWIYNKRCKNNNQYWVPLSEEAQRIHEKYNGKLPKIPLVTYNRKLKVAAEREKINKNLSSHTARKTFATRMYEAGWSLEAISDMMGITMVVLVKHYIKKSRRRLENEVLVRAQIKKEEAKVFELKVVV